jgi:hypothetical protein
VEPTFVTTVGPDQLTTPTPEGQPDEGILFMAYQADPATGLSAPSAGSMARP